MKAVAEEYYKEIKVIIWLKLQLGQYQSFKAFEIYVYIQKYYIVYLFQFSENNLICHIL